VSAVIAAADGWRRLALRLVLRGPGIRAIFIRPERRVPVAEALCVATAAATSVASPVVSLWLGASVLGLPHILSGIRHVAVRRSLHPLTRVCVLASVILGVLTLVHLTSGIPFFIGLFALSMAIEVLTSTAPTAQKAVFLPGVALGAVVALHWSYFFVIAVTHLHTLTSLSFFSIEARRRGIRVWPLWGLSLLVVAAALSGALDTIISQRAWAQNMGPDAVVQILGHVVDTSSATMLARSLFFYAFGQSLHYMVWLRLVPEVDRSSPVPQSFSLALANLKRDFGRWTVPALALCVVGGIAMIVSGRAARDAYFVLVYFHIGLEAAGWLRLRLNSPRYSVTSQRVRA
jgi:hypothetical protein